MGADEWLRDLNDSELQALVAELEERVDQFDAKTRMQINDELRRRRMALPKARRY